MDTALLAIAFALALLCVAVVVAMLRRGAPRRIFDLRCPSCDRIEPLDLSRVKRFACPGCGYIMLNRGGKTGRGPGWIAPPVRPLAKRKVHHG